MGDFSYWMTVLQTSGWFILWTLICAALVYGAEYVARKAFKRKPIP